MRRRSPSSRRARARALGAAFRGPLRRAHASFAAMWAGESAFVVALAVVAFGEGGVAAVGVVTAVRMATAALLTPFLAALGDRVRRERVLTVVGVVRAALLAGAAVLTATGGPAPATYCCAVVATAALALFRPAHSALLPALANSPADLTAANAVRGTLDSLANLGGPAAAAALLAASGPAAVFTACSVASLLGGLVVVGLPYNPPPRARAGRRSAGRDVVEGFTTIAASRPLSLITALGIVQTITRGCLTVFVVAVAIKLLDTGNPGVGVLNGSIGAGGLLGSLFALRLVRRGGLATWFGVGVALFGAPLALMGGVPVQVAVIALLGLVGVGNVLTDIGGFTMLARLTDETVLVRMFAGFEAIMTLGVAVGGLIAPLLIQLLDVRGALVAVGLVAPAAVLAARPALRRLDGELRVRDADIGLLRTVPMLGLLPAVTIDQLCARLEHAEFAPGQVVFTEDDAGDAYFVVESGRARVIRHGVVVDTLGPGTGFGEVALLGRRPRTATIRAGEDAPLRVAVLEQSAFLTAVTGYPVSAGAGEDTVAGVLARDAARRAGDGGAHDAPPSPSPAPRV